MELLKKALEDKSFTDIIGQEQAKRQLASALSIDRHVVISGPPGIGKTTLAKNVARLLPELRLNQCQFNCSPERPICPACRRQVQETRMVKGADRFVRVQGSPDLTVEDLLGDIDPVKAIKFGSMSHEAFVPGKIFKANNGVLFFDELNRCPEKLQNALLQVLEERRATIGSYEIDLEADFIFIATMNPHDTSTERLSDVLLDRFDVVYMGYPETSGNELQIIKTRSRTLAEMADREMRLIVGFVRQLRSSDKLEKLPSVRASIGLYERASANAYLMGRKLVGFQDIKDSVVSVLAHRIRLKPSIRYLEEPEDFVRKEFEKYVEEKGIGPAPKGGEG